jgi:hypothetical protein
MSEENYRLIKAILMSILTLGLLFLGWYFVSEGHWQRRGGWHHDIHKHHKWQNDDYYYRR